eukprot:58000_1
MGNKQAKSKKGTKDDDDDKKKEEKEETPPLPDEAEALDDKWKTFYSGNIAKFHRNRAKFIFLGSLAKTYRVKAIENKQFGYWYKDENDNMTPKCDEIYADFSINFTLNHNETTINLKLSAIFNNRSYEDFDDNFATKEWTIKLILLDQDLKVLWKHFFSKLPCEIFSKNENNKTDIVPIIYDYLLFSKTTFIDDIYLYKNGELNDVNSGLLDAYIGINLEDGDLHIAEYFDILLQWFLSQDATDYRKTYVKTEMIWQN